MTEDHPTPAEALAAIQRSRQSVHDRVATRGWPYDLAYAALAAIMVGLVWVRREIPDAPVWQVAAVSAGLAFVVALIGSRIWRRVYRAEMRLEK